MTRAEIDAKNNKFRKARMAEMHDTISELHDTIDELKKENEELKATHHRGSGGYGIEEIKDFAYKLGGRYGIHLDKYFETHLNELILSLSNQESKKGFSGNEEVFYEFLEFMRKEMHVDIQWNDKYVIGTWQDKIQSLTPKEKDSTQTKH